MRISLSKDASSKVTVKVSESDDLESDLSVSHSFSFDITKDHDKNTVEVFDKIEHPVGRSLRKYGRKLFDALFEEGTHSWELLRKIRPPQSNGPILLELNGHQDLDDVAWEYAWAGNAYLVHLCMFTRIHKRAGHQHKALPLRIVVAAPDPLDSHKVGLADLHLSDQFQNFIDEYHKNPKKVILERVLPATVNKMDALLEDRLTETATVLHFMGHCASKDGSRALIFEHRDTGEAEFVSTPRLISDPEKLRLVFLSACNSREVARTMVQQGVQYAIGSSCDLPDDIARKFEAQFYYCLAKGQSVDKAMFRTRLDLSDVHDYRQRDYLAGAMILYSTTSQASDGLFLCDAGYPTVDFHLPHNNLGVKIPTSPTFCGRQEALARLNYILRRMATRAQQSPRVCTITGISGQGKTTLAIKAVKQIQHSFPGGIFAWQFHDDAPISAVSYLWELVNVLLPDQVNKIFPNGEPAPSLQTDGDHVQSLGWKIFQRFRASSLLILDHADTWKRQQDSHNKDAVSLWTLLQGVSSNPEIPVKFLVTSNEFLMWPALKEELHLDGFLSDINSGIEVFIGNLSTSAREKMSNEVKLMDEEEETVKMNDVKRMPETKGNSSQLLRDLVTQVDGHPLCLHLLAEVVNSPNSGNLSLKSLVRDQYDTLLRGDAAMRILDYGFGTMINALPTRQRLLLYTCSLFSKPVENVEIIEISKCFDYEIPTSERLGSSDDLHINKDLQQLCHQGLLLEKGDNQYRSHIAVRIVARQLSAIFKLQKNKANDFITQHHTTKEGCVEGLRLLMTELGFKDDKGVSLGTRNRETATSLDNRASHYKNQGMYDKAEPLYKQALAIYEKELGEEHPDTATALNNLALLYYVESKFDKAELMHQRALAIREKVLGLENPYTALSLNNLALVYNSQGKYDKAEPLYKRSLAIREKEFGSEHPDTATTLNNLALLYNSQGKYDEAEPLYERSQAIREKVLGSEHEDMAQSLNNLGWLYQNQAKYDKAEPLYERAIMIWEKTLGSEHPNTAQSLNNLAEIYFYQKKYDKAKPLFERALAIREKRLGSEHQDTKISRNDLDICLCYIH